ncbi:S8/S53 family peptidase [Amycolatopsis sp. NPDC005961]|uniref:S8 family peptidase n=1 Tax=Amycolatopsis sp. NPDC005961 TaxID=3156720 RepID=UPI0034003FF2
MSLIRDLAGIPEFATKTRAKYWHEISALERRSGRRFTDLDVLLYEVRNQFAYEDGAVPAIGKNRDTLIGYPQHKGVGDPDFGDPIGSPGGSYESTVENPVRVGIVDTPLYWHPEFPKGRIIPEPDVEAEPDRKGVYSVWAGHATFVAGRIWQCAPHAQIIVKAALNDRTGDGTSWDTARKIAAFRDEGIQVLNLSFGTATADGEPPMALRRAIDVLTAANKDLQIVAAAGNLGHIARPPWQIWPAAMNGVLAVGATGADFSMKRDWVDTEDDGLRVNGYYLDKPVRLSDASEQNFEGYARWSGTSFAAAAVTGKIARELASVKS